MKKIAVIDLGSNSVRMNIAQLNPNGTTDVLAHYKLTVRLSEGMGDDMTLKEIPINRTISALSEFNDIIKESGGVDEVIAIATAAVRKAVNKEYFLSRAYKETGIDIKVIDGDKEAVYDYLGVISKLNISECIIVDIGGGSTEIIVVKDRVIKGKVSIPIGSVSISEKFLQANECEETIKQAKEYVNSYINSIEFLKDAGGLPIIGLGGGLRTIAKIDIEDMDFDKFLHGHEVSTDKVFEIYDILISKTVEERCEMRGVGKERADIIVGGMLPIISIINMTDSQKLIISDSGVRDGLIFEQVGKMFIQILKACEEL